MQQNDAAVKGDARGGKVAAAGAASPCAPRRVATAACGHTTAVLRAWRRRTQAAAHARASEREHGGEAMKPSERPRDRTRMLVCNVQSREKARGKTEIPVRTRHVFVIVTFL